MGILYLVYVPAADVRRYRPPGADEGETIYLPSIQTVSGLVQVDLAAGTYLHAGPGEREPVGVALRAVRVRAPRPRDEQLERTKIAAPIDPWGYVDLWVDSARLSPSGD